MDERPKLREDLELLVADAEEEQILVIRDPEMLATDFVRFGMGALALLRYLDGARTLEDIRTDLAARGAGSIDREQLELFVQALDRCLLLDNANAQAERDARVRFVADPVRPAAHAGAAYPAEREPAHAFFQAMLERADPRDAAPLDRLIAPHIDLKLGEEVHAHAHRRLAASGRPDVVVVLGVRHEAGARRFVACRKDFDTPLGTVRHDARLLDALEARLGDDLSQGQIAHRNEHSVEFQALWLAHLWPDDPPAIVPLLVGSFHDLVESKESPARDEEIEAFIGALKETVREDARRVVTVASVDFAHVGPVYEDPEGLDAAGERDLESKDRALIDHVVAGDAEAFFDAIAADGNARHVCGVAPIYVTLRMGDTPGELLKYGQGRIHPESGSVVSFAALSFAD